MSAHPLKTQVREFYDQYHRQRRREPDKYWLTRIWSLFDGKVLEVGAGRLLWRPPTPIDYVVIDFSSEAIRHALRSGTCGVIGDGESLPCSDGQFDLVACHDVLEHTVNPERLVAEMCRVSRGRVLVAGPNYVGTEYAPGFDRYLPLRAARFLFGDGRGKHVIEDAHLSFDKEWEPDKDAITATNSWWVMRSIRRHNFQATVIETWPKEFHRFNRVPILRHIGPFMLIVGKRWGEV